MVIFYIFSRFDILFPEKSGNPVPPAPGPWYLDSLSCGDEAVGVLSARQDEPGVNLINQFRPLFTGKLLNVNLDIRDFSFFLSKNFVLT
jgi:hypothetical protein